MYQKVKYYFIYISCKVMCVCVCRREAGGEAARAGGGEVKAGVGAGGRAGEPCGAAVPDTSP